MMATAFMRWLETRPGIYDRGIRWLTFGKLPGLQRALVQRHLQPEQRVLEIGCGTGSLTIAMAQAGARITAIDLSEEMLELARQRASLAGHAARIEFHHMDAALLGERFRGQAFDRIVASLSLSEMGVGLQERVLATCFDLLGSEGRLVIIDEARPDSLSSRLLSDLIRVPLRALTWLLTRTTTHPLRNLERKLAAANFIVEDRQPILRGMLRVWTARPAGTARPQPALETPPEIVLKQGWAVVLLDLWGLLFRIIPPYPKFTPGLYRIGSPDERAVVLVTGNFELTVRRLVNAVRGRLDAWLLIVDTGGINVWCAAGGGFLTTEKIIGALETTRTASHVSQRVLILPQLCANGVDGWKIREETDWAVHWGPVRARDLPDYLQAGRKKSDRMRWVSFPIQDRLEMMAVTLGFYGLLILIPAALFWPDQLLAVAFGLIGLSLFYAVFHPWLPGRDGMVKSLPLSGLALLGMWGYTLWLDPAAPPDVFNRVIGMVGLSVFVAGEMQGMSPKMRGEQANWIPEAVVGVTLLAAYFIVPLLAGWR